MSGQSFQPRFSRQSRRLLFQFFGGDSWLAIGGAIVFLISIGWLADSLAELLKSWVGGLCSWPLAGSVTTLSIAGGLILIILGLARRATRDDEFNLRQTSAPKVKGLILYLSRPSDDQIEALSKLDGDLRDREFRALIGTAKNPTRMPVEAIAYHLPMLESVVILDSKELHSGTPGQGGSFEFRAPLAALLQRWGLPDRVRLRYAEEFDPKEKRGIDFFVLQEIFDVTKKAYAALLAEGLGPEEILIDISGGNKWTTCAGSSVAIGDGRSYQYVHTHTYEVLACNPEYDPAPKA